MTCSMSSCLPNRLFPISRKMPRNLFEAHVQRMISDAEHLADQERIDVVLVCFDPQLG